MRNHRLRLGFIALFLLACERHLPAQAISSMQRDPRAVDRLAWIVSSDQGTIPVNPEPIADLLASRGYDVQWNLGRVTPRGGMDYKLVLQELFELRLTSARSNRLVSYVTGSAFRRSGAPQDPAYWLSNGIEALEYMAIPLTEVLAPFEAAESPRKLLLMDFVVYQDVPDARQFKEATPRRPSGPLSLREVESLSDDNHIALSLTLEAAVELGSVELVGEATMTAFASNQADENSNGDLSAEELIRFVHDAVLARLEENAIAPDQYELSYGISEDWVVAEAPESKTIVEETLRDRYLATLREWRSRKLISVGTELACRSALNDWIHSLQTGRPIANETRSLLESMRRTIDAKGYEEERAKYLEGEVAKVRGTIR